MQNVLRALKIFKMKDFKRSKTKTLKAKISNAKTSKTQKYRKCEDPKIFFRRKLCFRRFRNSFSLTHPLNIVENVAVVRRNGVAYHLTADEAYFQHVLEG